jgi:hypothetical protein
MQAETVFASPEELDELLMVARQRLPVVYHDGGPPLGYFFDPVPMAAPHDGRAPEVGEKRKRVVVDDYEMEGGEGGDLNVMRMVSSLLALHFA